VFKREQELLTQKWRKAYTRLGHFSLDLSILISHDCKLRGCPWRLTMQPVAYRGWVWSPGEREVGGALYNDVILMRGGTGYGFYSVLTTESGFREKRS
jgi:hypothetical protein